MRTFPIALLFLAACTSPSRAPEPPASAFEVFPLRHASAHEVADTIREWLVPPDSPEFGSVHGLIIQCDPRTNSLLVGVNPGDTDCIARVRELVARLDVEVRPRRAARPAAARMEPQASHILPGVTRVFVVRHAAPAELVDILSDLLEGSERCWEREASRSFGVCVSLGFPPHLPGHEPEDCYRFAADPTSGSIVVTAPADRADDMERIYELIQCFDCVSPTIQQEGREDAQPTHARNGPS